MITPRSTATPNHLIAYIKKAGLSFAICYEDQTIKHLVNDGSYPRERSP